MKQTLSRSTHETDCEIGARIRQFRKAAGISQETVGEALGISFQQVQKYENGKNRVAVSTLIRICQILGVGPMDIIGAHFEGGGGEPTVPNRVAQRLAEAEQQLAQVRAIVVPRRTTLIAGVDLATQPDMTAFHRPQ